MGFRDDVTAGVDGVLTADWDVRDGRVFPEQDDVKLRDGAVKLEATWLYADMANSSKLAQSASKDITGKVIRAYLNAAARILRHHGGEIRSFDGDRVMAVFMGGNKNNTAVNAALNIAWAIEKVIRPKLETKWPVSLKDFYMTQGIGIATGEALIVRGGVQKFNDLVSIGDAPNVAAKLSEIRTSKQIHATKLVYDSLVATNAKTLAGDDMWEKVTPTNIGGKVYTVYGCGYFRPPA